MAMIIGECVIADERVSMRDEERALRRILTDIGDPLLHLGVGSHANQKLELGICGSQPERRD